MAMSRPNRLWEQLGSDDGEPPSVQYRRLRLVMLAAERKAVLRMRDENNVDQEILSAVLATFDLEEAMITTYQERVERVAEELATPTPLTGRCEHLQEAPETAMPQTPQGCVDCLREGLEWVHLRLCLTCGNVGCCDSSVGEHAEKHFRATGHPVMRSFEPGESWRWCYLDLRVV